MLKHVLFDLDGTLLPLDQDEFINTYFAALGKYVGSHISSADEFFRPFYVGVRRMAENDGTMTNEDAFWSVMESAIPTAKERFSPILDDFYRNEFDKIIAVTRPSGMARDLVDFCHERGLTTVLATSPVFPRIATEKRMAWVDLRPSDFELVTSYENSRYTKPTAGYYTDICEKLGLEPAECLMVGNDALDDLGALAAGIQVFLLTNNFLNKNGVDISDIPNGDENDLKRFILKKLAEK
jgi:FMN phosphatase YigB (HAD superfamily)